MIRFLNTYTFTLIQKSVTEYGCESGECIDVSNTCDGKQDCSDGSDETRLLCEMVL